MLRTRLIGAAALALAACGVDGPAPTSEEVFALPAPGEATGTTRAANAAFGARLPLDDRRDFENARRGFLAEIEGGTIRAEDGRVVWDQSRFDFLEAEAPATVNPSLWRQAQLNRVHGLFEVTEGIYQLRGYDLAVMTLIRGETGWIVVDPLLAKETAAAAFALAQETLGEAPVTAVLYTHSHADHFGGVRGLVTEEDIEAGRVRIIAPEGFAEEAVSENVLAGPAMVRRAQYQFGNALDAGPAGLVDSGIGKTTAAGSVGFIPPTETVGETGERRVVDGVEFVFIYAPGTEAPAEFMFYLPDFRALSTAELATGSLHNILTPRGAQVRDALAWSKRLADALEMFGGEAQVVFASHNLPRWGNEEVRRTLENQRDVYRHIHDQTLRLANHGSTMREIAEEIGEPAFMGEDFSVRGYYGSLNHNAKAVYQRYFGWWDGNPANFNPHPPVEEAKRYVELAGGAAAMIANAERAFADGDYRWTATVMNHLVFAEPRNRRAKEILASAYDQLGFQSESAIWRNIYLTGAKELREGVMRNDAVSLANPDFVKAIETAQFFDALAVRVNPEKAAQDFVVNFVFTDTGETVGVSLRDGVAAHRAGGFDGARITATMTRAIFDDITLGRASFQGQLAKGGIKVEGNPIVFGQFLMAHDQFDLWFNIVTP